MKNMKLFMDSNQTHNSAAQQPNISFVKMATYKWK